MAECRWCVPNFRAVQQELRTLRFVLTMILMATLFICGLELWETTSFTISAIAMVGGVAIGFGNTRLLCQWFPGFFLRITGNEKNRFFFRDNSGKNHAHTLMHAYWDHQEQREPDSTNDAFLIRGPIICVDFLSKRVKSIDQAREPGADTWWLYLENMRTRHFHTGNAYGEREFTLKLTSWVYGSHTSSVTVDVDDGFRALHILHLAESGEKLLDASSRAVLLAKKLTKAEVEADLSMRDTDKLGVGINAIIILMTNLRASLGKSKHAQTVRQWIEALLAQFPKRTQERWQTLAEERTKDATGT